MDKTTPQKHRQATLRLTLILLGIWFVISLGAGILFRDWLDARFPEVGNAPFGFWMAQQGSIIGFILLLIAYAVLMDRLDRRFGYSK